MGTDFIPNTWAAYAVWMANFTAQLGGLAAKYNLTAMMATVKADNDWIQHWIPAKAIAKQEEKQLTDFVALISNGKEGDAQPSVPIWELPAGAPPNVSPGIKNRVRAIARQIKANGQYTRADGELLGIVTAEEANLSPDSYTPSAAFDSMANFALECEFRKYGLDALRVEFRRKGGEWKHAATLTSSPGGFNIHPTTAGVAEQIELRCVFIVKNQPYGNYSPIYTAVIQP